jgi:hypothetical protein
LIGQASPPGWLLGFDERDAARAGISNLTGETAQNKAASSKSNLEQLSHSLNCFAVSPSTYE